MNLNHMHVHTEYSFLDGLSSAKSLATRAKELGMTAIAITDHNSLCGVYDFQHDCEEIGIKPILGSEMYYTPDTNILSKTADDRKAMALEKAIQAGVEIPKKATAKAINELIEPYAYNTKQYHILFLAMNQKGWSNLIKLNSEASEKCTYNGRYMCDLEMIKKYNEGLIMTTACIGSYPANLIKHNKENEAKEWIKECHKIFGDRLYLEIQPLNNIDQIKTNYFYMIWAEELGIKLVATNDVHYTFKEDFDDHDTLICIGTKKLKSDENRMHYSHDFWLRSYDEMIEAFSIQAESAKQLFKLTDENYKKYLAKIETAIATTLEITDRIDEHIKLGSDVDLFPRLEIPFNFTSEKYLTLLSYQGLNAYLKKHPECKRSTYEKRLCFELGIINKKGFAPYMLAVYEYVNWCRENDIPVGPGRGSAAGSLCLFSIGVTNVIDPIKYNLLFSRFLTEDRTSPPDIDCDFSYFRRDDVVKHLEDKYGAEKVCHIGTFTEMGVKNGLKDVGRVLEYSFADMNSLTKQIDTITDSQPGIKFKDLDDYQNGDNNEQNKYRAFKALEEQYPELFRLARKFEGVKRGFGVHASGVLVTPDPVTDLFPTRVDPETGVKVSLYTGPQLEKLKAIKFDILGLKNLDIIDLTIKSLNPNNNILDFYETTPLKDEKVYQLIANCCTDGVFQLESDLFKNIIKGMQPTNINDIIALVALGRPGPLGAGMDVSYARCKNGLQEAKEPLYNTWDIVSNSYGTIIYQEQIMLISQRVAKFNDNQADSYLRKGLGKKKQELVDMCGQWFIYGKRNEPAPKDYDEKNLNQPMYDPDGKYGSPILGGIANGYDEQELLTFWEAMKGYAKYLFNQSHSATYGFISYLTAYLKYYYPSKYLASVLSLQENAIKIDRYVKVARSMNIKVLPPDINKSEKLFKEEKNKIYYGLNTIKGVGETAIPEILENRPYTGIEDALNKISKKAFNKRTGIALIKGGAFDFEDTNRYSLINKFYDIRKDKDERLDEAAYGIAACNEFEKEVLSSYVSHVPYWETVKTNKTVEVEYNITNIREKQDKNGRLMAFLTGTINECEVNAIVFASTYCKNINLFNKELYPTITLKGKKDDKGTFVVSSAKLKTA